MRNESHKKTSETILQMPVDRLVKEGESQCDRAVEEVMQALFTLLPTDSNRSCDFTLSDGTQCWIKAFSEPQVREDGELVYGFDVKFGEGRALSHMEFSVKCSGWERALLAPTS